MQTRNRLFDDAARLAGGAVGTLAGIRREVEALVRQQLDRVLSSMDLVSRDEFDAVREMAVKARTEQETLTARVAALEKALAKAQAQPAAKPKPPTRRKASRPKTGARTGGSKTAAKKAR